MKTKIQALCVLVLLTSTIVQAQLQKGSILMGSAFNVSHSKTSYENQFGSISKLKSSAFDINPDVGYFVVDRLVFGVKIPIGYSKTTTYSDVVKTYSYAAGIFSRYYIPLDKWAVFATTSFERKWFSNEVKSLHTPGTDWHDSKSEKISRIFSAGMGVTYFVKKNIGLEAIASWQKSQLRYKGQNDVYRSGSLNLNIGFQIYL